MKAAPDQPGAASSAIAIHPIEELPQLIPQLAHGRPLLVHFCATWCEACRDEFVRERKLFRGLDARGVSMALIWIDDAKTRPRIAAMLKRYRLQSLQSLVLDAPDSTQVAKAMGEPRWDGALPATFVFDAHQAKLTSFLGAADAGLLAAAVDEAIRRAK